MLLFCVAAVGLAYAATDVPEEIQQPGTQSG
jgi:hypothetical protein